MLRQRWGLGLLKNVSSRVARSSEPNSPRGSCRDPSPICHSFFDWHHIWPTFSNFEPENYRDITWPNMNSKYPPGTKIQIVIGVINLKAYILIHFSDYLILTVSDPNLGFRMRKIIKALNQYMFQYLWYG